MLALLWVALPLFVFQTAPSRATDLVDLHAHFFMPEASGFPGFGSFNEPLRARSWSSWIKTRVNADSLIQSGVKIAIVALYSHAAFFGSHHDIIRRQIADTEAFVRAHPDWIIARGPREARAALAQGKHALILSIEGASGIVESEDDLREFVDRLGVRIITPVHFTDDRIGGAAFMPGIEIWANPIAAIESFFSASRDSTGVRVNDHGLTPAGKELVAAMIRHGVWIDLAHASDATYRDVVSQLRAASEPILFTHTILRSANRGERGISASELRDVRDSGGIIGLLPSDHMLRGTSVDPRFCPAECGGRCDGGSASFLSQYAEITKIVPSSSVMIGSDIDAPLTFLKPPCEAARQKDPRGYWNYAQLSDLVEDLRQHQLITPEDAWVESFLKAWERVKKDG